MSLSASNAPTESEPRASPGVGTLELVEAAGAGSEKRQKSVSFAPGGPPSRTTRR